MARTTDNQPPGSAGAPSATADAQSRAEEETSGIALWPVEQEGDLDTLLDALATILARLAREQAERAMVEWSEPAEQAA